MLNKIKKSLPFINSIAIILLLCLFVANHFLNTKKVVYVDDVRLFDNFNMTREMKQAGQKEFNSKKAILDSLYIKLQSNDISEVDKKTMMTQLIQGKEDLEQFNRNFAIQETEKIWKRLNEYVDAFSSKQEYTLIIGSENKRDVLFVDRKIDITNELITYINEKYEGK